MTKRERMISQVDQVLKSRRGEKRRRYVRDLVTSLLSDDEDLRWLAREIYLGLIKNVEKELAELLNSKGL